MDTRKLKYFLAVVDHEGFHRAAEHLLIAQPSLSQTIAGLEKELGVPLFHRIGRRVVLSDAGKALVGPARVVLRDLDAAEAAVQSLKSLASGRLDISTMPSPGIEPLTSMIARFTQQNPAVHINATAAFTPDEVIEAVRSGSSEIGLAGTASALLAPGIDVIELEVQPLILIVNPHADSFGAGASIDRAELDGCRMIASQQGSLMRWLVDDALAHGVHVEIVIEVAHRTSILPLVSQGVGHAVMPSAWRESAERAGLRTLQIDPVSHLHVSLLSRKANLTPAASAFVEIANLQVKTPSRS